MIQGNGMGMGGSHVVCGRKVLGVSCTPGGSEV